MSFPKKVNSWKGKICSPVTQVVDAETKIAWKNEIGLLQENGNQSSAAPKVMIDMSESRIIRPAEILESSFMAVREF